MAASPDPNQPSGPDLAGPREAEGPAGAGERTQAEEAAGHGEAGDTLASVFDNWQWDLYQTVPPSKRLEDRLAELLSGVETWKAEVQTTTGELQSRLFGEMRVLEAKLEGLRNSGAEGQEGFKQALNTIWRETQQVSSAVQAWSASAQSSVEDRAKLVQSLEIIAQRVAEAQDNVVERQQVVASQLAALVDALRATQERAEVMTRAGDVRVGKVIEAVDAGFKRHEKARTSTENLLGSLTERLALLETTTEVVAESHDELKKSLEAQGAASAAGLEATQAGMVRSLEAIDGRMAQRHAEAATSTGRLQASLSERLWSLETTIASVRERLGFLEAAAGSIVEHHDKARAATEQLSQSVTEGLGSVESRIGAVGEGLGDLTSAIAQMQANLVQATEQSRAALMEGLQRVGAGVAEALTTAAAEREDLKAQVATLTDSVRQLRPSARGGRRLG